MIGSDKKFRRPATAPAVATVAATDAPATDAPATDAPATDAEVVAGLEARIAALEGRAPIPGPQGPKGDPGPQGPRGPAGIDGADGRDGRDGRDGLDAPTPQSFYEKNWGKATAARRAAVATGVVAAAAATTVAVAYGVKYYRGRGQAALPEVTVGMS